MTKTRTIEMLVFLSLLLFLSVSQPASAQPADGGSSGTATEENTAPSQESQRASASAAQSNGIPERNPNCDKQACTTNLTCIDYGRIFSGVATEVKVCDCTSPVAKDCYCISDGVVYRRWEYQDKPKSKPSLPEGTTPPKAGYSRPGCYLEYGETCNLLQVDNETTDTYNICKHGLYCKAIKGSDMWGYCISTGVMVATAISSQISLLIFINVSSYLR